MYVAYHNLDMFYNMTFIATHLAGIDYFQTFQCLEILAKFLLH